MSTQLAVLVLVGIGLIFVADLIGNFISFGNRVINALVTSIVWCVLFVGLVLLLDLLLGYNIFEAPGLDPTERQIKWTLGGVVFAFIADLIGNYLTFKHRIGNALVTSVVWAVLYAAYLAVI